MVILVEERAAQRTRVSGARVAPAEHAEREK